jgi:Tfp pilus assembly protein PilF
MLLPLIVVVVGLAAYAGSLHGPFVFDDNAAIRNNTTIRQLWPPGEALSPPPRCAITGRPVVNFTLAVNYALHGLDVEGYHVFNIAVHLLVALALYGVVRRTLVLPGLRETYGASAAGLALASALIWVVHPLATEAVSYTAQRTELMMALFFLLALYCLIRASEDEGPGRGWYAAAFVAVGLGAGSKEVMIASFPVALAYDRIFLSNSLREVLRRRWWFHSAIAVVLVASVLLAGRVQAETTSFFSQAITPWDYLKTQSGVLVHYLRLSVWPQPLVADYDDWPIAHSLLSVLPSALTMVGLLVATVWALRYRPSLGFFGLCFFAILAPTSSFWPLSFEIAAERRMYLPLAGIVTLAVIGMYLLLQRLLPGTKQSGRREMVAVVLVFVVTGIFAQLTSRRNEDYESVARFWSDIVDKRPRNVRARINYGDHLFKSGNQKAGLVQFEQAVRFGPDNADAHYGYGVTLAAQSRNKAAEQQYREALLIDPDHDNAHNNLATLLYVERELDEAILHFSEALRIAPDRKHGHFNLGLAYERAGRIDDALHHMQRALAIDPSSDRARQAVERLERSRP